MPGKALPRPVCLAPSHGNTTSYQWGGSGQCGGAPRRDFYCQVQTELVCLQVVSQRYNLNKGINNQTYIMIMISEDEHTFAVCAAYSSVLRNPRDETKEFRIFYCCATSDNQGKRQKVFKRAEQENYNSRFSCEPATKPQDGLLQNKVTSNSKETSSVSRRESPKQIRVTITTPAFFANEPLITSLPPFHRLVLRASRNTVSKNAQQNNDKGFLLQPRVTIRDGNREGNNAHL